MPLCILWRREGNQVMGGFHSGEATIILSYIRGTPSGGLQPIHGGGKSTKLGYIVGWRYPHHGKPCCIMVGSQNP